MEDSKQRHRIWLLITFSIMLAACGTDPEESTSENSSSERSSPAAPNIEATIPGKRTAAVPPDTLARIRELSKHFQDKQADFKKRQEAYDELSSLVRKSIIKDDDTLETLLNAITPQSVRDQFIGNVLVELSKSNPAVVEKWLDLLTEEFRERVVAGMYMTYSTYDPAAALRLIDQEKQDPVEWENSRALVFLHSFWDHPKAAKKLWDSLPAGGARKRMIGGLLSRMHRAPQRVMDFLSKLTDPVEIETANSGYPRVFFNMTEQQIAEVLVSGPLPREMTFAGWQSLFQRDPNLDLASMIERTKAAPQLSSRLIHDTVSRRAQVDPVQLAQEWPTLENSPEYNGLTEVLVTRWAERDPASASQWILSDVRGEKLQETLLQATIGLWLETDSDSALSWVAHNAPDAMRTSLSLPIIDQLTRLERHSKAENWREWARELARE